MSGTVANTRYFTMVDESGRAESVVEFWSGSVDYEQLVYQAVPLKRFIKVLGSGEYLKDEGSGVFVEGRTGRRLFPLGAGGQA
jgi:hypothetical protein